LEAQARKVVQFIRSCGSNGANADEEP
jgi:hypothetical protein